MKKIRYCPECGNEIKGRSKYCCYSCSIPATLEACKQMREKEGPIYEKWKARLKASMECLK